MRKLKWFKLEEFVCPHCGEQHMDKKFLKKIDKARAMAGIPFRLNSAYRCKDYQRELQKQGYETAKGISPHEYGVAVDIDCDDGESRYIIIMACHRVGITRFGIAKGFIHADADMTRRQNYVWVYQRR